MNDKFEKPETSTLMDVRDAIYNFQDVLIKCLRYQKIYATTIRSNIDHLIASGKSIEDYLKHIEKKDEQ